MNFMSETNKFPLISGNLSLDLVNTELVSRGQRQDLLPIRTGYAGLAYCNKRE